MSDRDAYEGAREDLLDWKRRALTAEAKVREYDQRIVGIGSVAINSISRESHEAALAEAVAKAWEEAEKVAEDCPCHWDGEQIAKAIRRARGAE